VAGERPKPILAGILLGGASSRMGRAKGLLPAPDGAPTLVARWVRLFESMTLPCVLVGERSEYAPLGLPLLADAMPSSGPLGGVVSLLHAASGGFALWVAVDMPFAPRALVERLASERRAGAAVAARGPHGWEPLFAVADADALLPLARARLSSGELSVAGLLDEASALALHLTEPELHALRDWDTPHDIARDGDADGTAAPPRR
jgi:molybdopterin-guanine dinucleotide biosynthesis protein A